MLLHMQRNEEKRDYNTEEWCDLWQVWMCSSQAIKATRTTEGLLKSPNWVNSSLLRYTRSAASSNQERRQRSSFGAEAATNQLAALAN